MAEAARDPGASAGPSGAACRQKGVELATGETGDDVSPAFADLHPADLGRAYALVRFRESQHADERLCLAPARIDLVEVLVVHRVVLRDAAVDDAQICQDRLQIVEQPARIQADCPLRKP